jgi:antitoxin VapB
MATGTVFTTNRTQAVRLPAETRFPEGVRRVSVQVRGLERVIAPVDARWDSFFDAEALRASDDFLTQRPSQHQAEREPF